MINIIVAVDQNEGIGKDGKLPWPKIPSDMKRFRDLTKNSVVIMGRKTYDSIGKPLKGRFNIVLTSNAHKHTNRENIVFSNDFTEALNCARVASLEACCDIFIIGGASIYKHYMPIVGRVMMTTVSDSYDCDTFFPFDTMHRYDWIPEELRIPNLAFHKDPVPSSFKILRKVKR